MKASRKVGILPVPARLLPACAEPRWKRGWQHSQDGYVPIKSGK